MTDIEVPHRSGGGSVAAGLVRAARPKQWMKNVLVAAAPIASGQFLESSVLLGVGIAFIAFCLAASAVYLLNDALDAEADRLHPRKRFRPIASGQVPPRAAYVLAAVLALASLGVSLLANTALLVTIAVYLAVQVLYCVRLKHEPVLDVAIVSSGFLLRAVGGAVAASLVPSQWFLLTAAFGSLFMAAGKRYAEKVLSRSSGNQIRPVLSRYTETYLRFMWTLSAGVLATTYSLWAFEITEGSTHLWAPISIVPFVLAVFRYAVDVDSGDAGEPEAIASRDRVLQVLAVSWLVTIALAVYL